MPESTIKMFPELSTETSSKSPNSPGLVPVIPHSDRKAPFSSEDLAKSSVQITMKTATLVTTNQERTDAVLSQFFLNATKYPEITFTSTKVEKSDDGLTLTGNLTICGVTKEVTFPFTMRGPRLDPFGASRVGVEGKMTLNRQDFGVAFDRKMKDGTPLVGDEVLIMLSVEFIQPPEE